MNRPEGAPPTYDDAMQATNHFAGASAPELPGPEVDRKALLAQDISSPMATVTSVSPAAPHPINPPVPSMAPLPQYQTAAAPQAAMPMYVAPPAPTTVYVTNAAVGPKPCTMVCPSCHQSIRTTTTVTNNSTAHLICCLMCIFGCCCCSCLPYCMSGFKITKHECPSCKAYLGTYRP